MADSDDEYDRKRRDKFRGERAEANYRGTERSVRTRDEWQEREAWSRPRPRDYRGSVRDRGYSPSMETAPKRIRHDYYGDSYYNHYQPYHQSSHREPQGMSSASESSQPPMMSFKAFLATQDDNISDSEAIEKYNDYKLEFQRQQLNEFFVAHKDDEWFRLKYHPEDSVKRKEEQAAALKKRVEVFLDLLNAGKLNSLSVDCHKTNELLKLLDTVVIKLEGGNEEDLELLEQEYAELEKKEQKSEENAEGNNSNETNNKESSNNKKDNSSKDVVEPETNGSSKEDGECPESQNNKKPSSSANAEDDDDGEIMQVDEEEESQLKAKKPDNYQGEDNNGKKQDKEKERSDDEDGNTKNKQNNDVEMEERGGHDEDDNTKTKNEAEDDREDQNRDKKSKNVDEEEEEDEDNLNLKKDNNTSKEKKRKRSYSGSSGSSSSSSSSDSDDEGNKKDNNSSSKKEKKDDAEGEDKEKIETIDDSSDKIEKPKALHKTTSIFLRNLAPTITRQEVEAMCSRYDGFLRVALADPQPDRRWLRRGWVTFKRDANIKEICWNLNNIRLRDCELGAIVNRDLSRRIRPVNGITAHKQVVRSDIRISAKVALHLDTKAGLWPENKEEKPQQTFGLVSNNPVLHNITDYLIEEASAEEEELLGLEPSSDTQDTASTVERDENLISVLDKIIMYLRIVHSVDYYNHCEYPNEDEMPNRCGILHARGPPPTTKTDISQFVGNPIETKMANFLPDKSQASSGRGNAAGGEDSTTSGSSSNKNETKLINLSLKDVDMEIDKFVQANTRELAKDKWLCPLSGKKFKGPDFVRKHIFNKHAEKIEEVKKEVEFFNNYLRDSKRPMMAEPTVQKREEPPPYSHSYGAPYAYGGPPRYYNQGYPSRPRGYAPRSRGNNSEFRPVIHYRDLDAPREPEEFI